jgi:hypothetical protein
MMSLEFDEKGKFFTDVITKDEVPATIQTTQHLIKGTVHVRRDIRLKDQLDQDEPFLAITNAKIMGAGDQAFEAPFLAVRRSQIVWVMPDETRGR